MKCRRASRPALGGSSRRGWHQAVEGALAISYSNAPQRQPPVSGSFIRRNPSASIRPFGETRDLALQMQPRPGAVAKDFTARLGDGRIVKGPDIQDHHSGPPPRLFGERRPEVGTEVTQQRFAAAAGAAEGLQFAFKVDGILLHRNQRRKRAAGEFLAIEAVTD